jgi:hypothetical protein
MRRIERGATATNAVTTCGVTGKSLSFLFLGRAGTVAVRYLGIRTCPTIFGVLVVYRTSDLSRYPYSYGNGM